VKYADDLVLLAKDEMVIQDMADRLIGIGRRYGIELNVEKSKGHENLKATNPNTECDRSKHLENVEYINCLICVRTNNTRCTHGILPLIAIPNLRST
jgi:hypothetical protein